MDQVTWIRYVINNYYLDLYFTCNRYHWMVALTNISYSLAGLPNLSDSKQMMYTSTDDSISIDDNHLGAVSKGALHLVEIC